MIVIRAARWYWTTNVRIFELLKKILDIMDPLALFVAVTILYVVISTTAAINGYDTLVLNLVAAVGLPLYGIVCSKASDQRQLRRARAQAPRR